MSWTHRLPSGDLVVDLRAAAPPDVVDGSVFAAVATELATTERVPSLRVWVLHDAAAMWCDGPTQLEQGLRAWLRAAGSGSLASGGSEVVVLPPGAARVPALVAVIQALGIPVHAVRRGGGLPLNTVELDGQRMTAMATPPLARQGLPPSLQPALDRVWAG